MAAYGGTVGLAVSHTWEVAISLYIATLTLQRKADVKCHMNCAKEKHRHALDMDKRHMTLPNAD